uniref:Uncharacterized protein n=1 Tax=Anguilla anguilla TaxID=7936 RepID=A0A0E9SIN8_ANGAN
MTVKLLCGCKYKMLTIVHPFMTTVYPFPAQSPRSQSKQRILRE